MTVGMDVPVIFSTFLIQSIQKPKSNKSVIFRIEKDKIKFESNTKAWVAAVVNDQHLKPIIDQVHDAMGTYEARSTGYENSVLVRHAIRIAKKQI